MRRGILATVLILFGCLFGLLVVRASGLASRVFLPLVRTNAPTMAVVPTATSRPPTRTPLPPTAAPLPTPTATLILTDTLGSLSHWSQDSPMTIAVIGDSWVDNRFITDPLTAWTEQHYGSSGVGWISANTSILAPARGGRRITGTWTLRENTTQPVGYGVDLGSSYSTEVGAAIRWQARFTGGTIHYLQQPGGGVLRWRVGDGPWARVDTRADVVALGLIPLAPQSNAVYFVTVEVVTPGVEVLGFDSWVDGPGVRVHKLGNGGATSGQYVSADAGLWQAGLSALSPDLVIILLGTNDLAANVVPSTYREQMAVLVTRVRTAVPQADIVLLAPGSNGIVRRYPTAWYNNELRRLAGEQHVAMVDGAMILGPYTDGSPLYTNPLHLNADGGAVLADALVDRLLP